jgi:hypothetical protein
LGNITDWESLGLLPRLAVFKTNEQESYIMLNGGDGVSVYSSGENENREEYFYSRDRSVVLQNFHFNKAKIFNLYNWKRTKLKSKESFVQTNYEKKIL